MPFVIRFVDKDDSISEEFMDFILCDEGTTGRAIADIILKLSEYGLDIKKVRGQCYDGAGNMAGRMNGAAVLIQGEVGDSKANYFHCSAHALHNSHYKSSISKEYVVSAKGKLVFFLIVHLNVTSALKKCYVGLFLIRSKKAC